MLGTETVVVEGDYVRDEDGQVVVGTGIGPVANCAVFPLSTVELVERGRESTDDAVRVFLPITSGLNQGTVLVVRGKTYQIDGNPEPYIDPDGDLDMTGYDVEASHRAG